MYIYIYICLILLSSHLRWKLQNVRKNFIQAIAKSSCLSYSEEEISLSYFEEEIINVFKMMR